MTYLAGRADLSGEWPTRPALVSLGTRLVLLGTIVTLTAIASAFALFSLEIRRQSHAYLEDLLVQNQKTVLDLQKRSLEELVWTSRVMTQSPTLRAAMETYASERSPRAAGRSDLLATVQAELDKIRGLLGKDLAVVTDVQGAVLAASPLPSSPGRWERSFATHPCVQRALAAEASAAESNFAVLERDGQHYRIGCVPIVLQDFVIGTLTVGERIDAPFLGGLQGSLGTDVVVTRGGAVVGSTLAALVPGTPAPEALASLRPRAGASADVVRVGGEEYVIAPLSLGSDAQGRPAILLLLKSLSRARTSASRSLLLALLTCGAFAMLLGSLAAWRVSRSILDPLDRFVAIMQTVAEGKDPSRHLEGPDESAEVRILKQAYNRLIDSLEGQKRPSS